MPLTLSHSKGPGLGERVVDAHGYTRPQTRKPGEHRRDDKETERLRQVITGIARGYNPRFHFLGRHCFVDCEPVPH